jgi:hypothetical protein
MEVGNVARMHGVGNIPNGDASPAGDCQESCWRGAMRHHLPPWRQALMGGHSVRNPRMSS